MPIAIAGKVLLDCFMLGSQLESRNACTAPCSRSIAAGAFPSRRWSVVQQKLQDDAGGNRNQDIVAAYLNPMVTTRRSTEVITAPVIDHILPVPVFDRNAIAPAEFMVRARASFFPSLIVVRATLVFTSIRPAAFVVATILLAAALCLFIATAIVATTTALGEGKSSRGQRHRHDGGNNCFTVHSGLQWFGKCHIRFAYSVVRLVPTWYGRYTHDRLMNRQMLCASARKT